MKVNCAGEKVEVFDGSGDADMQWEPKPSLPIQVMPVNRQERPVVLVARRRKMAARRSQ